MSKLLISFSILVSTFNIWYLEITIESILLHLIFFASLFSLLKRKLVFKNHIIFFQVLFYLFFCHLLTPFIVFIDFVRYSPDLLINQLNLGLVYMTLTIGFFMFLFPRIKRHSKRSNFVQPRISLFLLLTVMYLLTGISYSLGLGKMGQETVVLPFKLTGLINYSRQLFAPYLFVIFLDAQRKNNINAKYSKIAIVAFVLWCLTEAFIRQSRSALVEYMIPTILYFILTNIWQTQTLIKNVTILIIVNILLFPLITNLRHVGITKERTTIERERETIWKRTFNNTFYYEKYQPIINDQVLDFTLAPSIILEGGSHNFTTNIIDDLEEISTKHNSGTSGLMDGYLFGGLITSFFVLMLALYFAVYFDKSWLLGKPLEVSYGFTLVKWLVWHRSISLLLTPMDLIVLVILYFIIRNK